MSPAELAGRARQKARVWLERTGVIPAPRWPLCQAAPGQAPHEMLTQAEEARLFPGAADPDSALLIAQRFPDECRRILSDADRIVLGRFDLLRHRGLFFGDPVDWHLDPLTGKRAPLMHWSRLHSLEPIPGGDPKLVWELNRHQWMVTLGQAWRLTGDDRYAEAFVRALRAWLKANPVGWGINWTSSLEASFRLIAWGWTLALLRPAQAMTPDVLGSLAAAMAVHASHIERNLSSWFSPNTHLTGEALGLHYAALLLPRMPRARHWMSLADRILREEIRRQVLEDGVYFEQSTCYQRYTIEIYLHRVALHRRLHQSDMAWASDRVKAMLDFLLSVRGPDGMLPQIGDGDGGRLLPFSPGPPEDARGMFALAAALYHRPDYAWGAGAPVPDLVWMLGRQGLDAFEALPHDPPEGSVSRLFPDGGYAILGSGWDPGEPRMLVDIGPLASPAAPGHGHADALSVQCWAHGEPYIADPGTYCYTTDPVWRDHFRGAGAHSTVLVDGHGAASPSGPFSWRELPAVRRRGWKSDPTLDVVDAEHDGFGGFPDPVTHRRRVAFIKPRYWVIVDDLAGKASHQIELRFQFHPGRRLSILPTHWVAASGAGRRGLLMRAFATVPLSGRLCQGELTPPQGWYSPLFGRRVPAPALVWSSVSRLPARVVTLVMPVLDVTAAPPHVSSLMSEGPRLVGIVLGDGEEFVMVNDREILLERRAARCVA